MLYRLIVGSTRLLDEETGEWVSYNSWDNNILDLTPSQAASLGRRVVPLVQTEEGVPVEASTARKSKSRRA